MSEQITLYSAKICPFAQRTELALEEVGAQYTRYEIDLQNKPEWYAPKVNPASKVPAIAYGGPRVPADQPSPESVKIAESLVLVEFVADLFPESHILPKDPVLRAKARFFIEVFSSKVMPKWGGLMRDGKVEPIFEAIADIQAALPDDTTFAVSNEFTIADIAVTPFFARLEVILREDFGVYAEGEGKRAYDVLRTDPKYAKWWKYFQVVKQRPSFKKTFDEDHIKTKFGKRWPARNPPQQSL